MTEKVLSTVATPYMEVNIQYMHAVHQCVLQVAKGHIVIFGLIRRAQYHSALWYRPSENNAVQVRLL